MAILPAQTFLFDLETSGLHKTHDQIISIGVLYEKEGVIVKNTFFISSLQEEKAQLLCFLKWCEDFETVATYRGKHFDYPFLLARLQFHQLSEEAFLRLKLVDMQLPLGGFSKNRKQLEAWLGFSRQSTTSGQEIAQLYKAYLHASHTTYRTLILRHQDDELSSLYALWELYHTLYHLKSLPVTDYKIANGQLHLTYEQAVPFRFHFNASAYGLKLCYDTDSALIHLIYPLFTGMLKHPLTPVKDYYYVESQKQLIHKSLAAFLPSSSKRRATKDECFIEETHTFLKLFSPLSQGDLWYDTENNPHLIWQEKLLSVPAQQLFYLCFQEK